MLTNFNHYVCQKKKISSTNLSGYKLLSSLRQLFLKKNIIGKLESDNLRLRLVNTDSDLHIIIIIIITIVKKSK